MDAKDISVTAPPEIRLAEEPPAYFQGASAGELSFVQFRCSYCGIACQAAVLPHSPQIAKFKCRQCNHVLDVQTRPSAMDAIEQEFDLRLDMKNLAERGKAFALPSRFKGAKLIG